MEFLTGFESTFIFGSGKDVLDTTGHTAPNGHGCYGADLARVAAIGIKTLRYSIPWHKIERERGVYDWQWMDAAMLCIDELGLEIIADPLHHTSFPEWLTLGFADPRFVWSYVDFVLAFAKRYPQVTRFTHINEPLVTSWFCGHEGVWHPKMTGDRPFVAMILNCAEAICRIDRALRAQKEITFVHVESCERHYTSDPALANEMDWANMRRFLVHDLITGKVPDQPVYLWLRRHGLSLNRAKWFIDNPAKIDVLGLDYYQHSEIWHGPKPESFVPDGFADVALDYANQYRDVPQVMLAETNVRGTPAERAAWFNVMRRECELLEWYLPGFNGQEFTSFCWYPFIDSCDWDSLVTRADGHIDPQGIYSLDDDLVRVETEFTRAFGDAVGATTQKGLDTRAALRKGAWSGPAAHTPVALR